METVVKIKKLSRYATDISLSILLVQKYLQCTRPPLSGAKVNNAWNYNSIPPYAFMMCTGTNVLSHYVSCLRIMQSSYHLQESGQRCINHICCSRYEKSHTFLW